MRKAIYGGSFNPIHLDHIALCRQIKNEFSLDQVILIPTHSTPLKDTSHFVSDEHRLNMCRLASSGEDYIEVSDIEILRKGLSYTSDTIAQLKNDEDELFLIVGADMFMTLEKWHDFTFIFENAVILTIPRGELDINILQKKYKELKAYGCKAEFSHSPVGPLSSTAVREKLKRGEDVSDCLHPDVIEYIRKNQLYG